MKKLVGLADKYMKIGAKRYRTDAKLADKFMEDNGGFERFGIQELDAILNPEDSGGRGKPTRIKIQDRPFDVVPQGFKQQHNPETGEYRLVPVGG